MNDEFEIKGKRKIENLRNTNSLFNGDQNQYISLIDSIIEVRDENVEDLINRIENYGKKFANILGCIDFAIKIRPKNRKSLLNLFEGVFSNRKEYLKRVDLSKEMKALLINKGYMNNKEKIKINDFPNDYPEGSIEKVIKEDDVDLFVKLTSDPEFKGSSLLESGHLADGYFIERGESFFESYYTKRITYFQMICYFGAVKCFKNAILRDEFEENYATVYAVAGGNLEIIKMMEQRGFSFDDCFEIAVKFHHDNICDWLLNNYKCKTFPVCNALEFYNYRAFLFELMNGFGTSQKSINYSLSVAIKNDYMETARYLTDNYEINTDKCNINSNSALEIAAKLGKLDFVKFFIEEKNLKVKDDLLQLATKNGNIDLVRYLVNNAHIDINSTDKNGLSALQVATIEENFEMIKYLVEEFHPNVESHIDKYNLNKRIENNTPLCIAAEQGNLDFVKYFIEECNADAKQISKKAFYNATKEENIELMTYLVENKDINTECLLHSLVITGNLDYVKLLVNNASLNIDEKDSYGRTPLMIAVSDDNFEMVKYLVEDLKANPGIAYKNALFNNNLEITKYFIEDCNVNIEKGDIDITDNQNIVNYLENQLQIQKNSKCHI